MPIGTAEVRQHINLIRSSIQGQGSLTEGHNNLLGKVIELQRWTQKALNDHRVQVSDMLCEDRAKIALVETKMDDVNQQLQVQWKASKEKKVQKNRLQV